MPTYEQILKWWENKEIANSADLETALNGYLVNFAYHSGKIENDNITFYDTREVFEHDGVTSYTGDLRTLFEINNAKEASLLVLDLFEEKKPIDEAMVKQVQWQLTKGTYDPRRYKKGERPGEFKKHDYVTGQHEVGAAPKDVPIELNELLEDITDNGDDKHALVIAAFFHAKFENIHPFSDGNGRTGRLLMNYLLVRHNHPPIIIHEEDRKQYYKALEAWDEKQELEPMNRFLKDQVVKTWEKQYKKDDSRA